MYRVQSAGSKGLGVFATRSIPKGTRIFSERPLLGLRHDQGPEDVYHVFQQLEDTDRKKLFQLSSAATTKLTIMRWLHALFYTARSGSLPWPRHLREHKTLLNIVRSNSFALNRASKFSQAIFPQIARLNHQCISNAQANFNDDTGFLNVHALKDIAPEEEITISYLDDAGDMLKAERQERLHPYGFSCGCNICQEGNAAAQESDERREAINTIAMSAATRESDQSGIEPSRTRELEALMKIVALMEQEGFHGRELAARYFVAAEWYKELGDVETALDCARRAQKIDEDAVGTDHKTYEDNWNRIREYEVLLGEAGAAQPPELQAAYA